MPVEPGGEVNVLSQCIPVILHLKPRHVLNFEAGRFFSSSISVGERQVFMVLKKSHRESPIVSVV